MSVAQRSWHHTGQWLEDRLVVPTQRVIPGRESQNTSRVIDDIWDLSCGIGRENALGSEKRINFRSLADETKGMAKEYLFLCMHFDHLSRDIPWRMTAVTPSAISTNLNRFMRLIGYFKRLNRSIENLDQADLDAWLISMRSRAPATIIHQIVVLRRLYVYRNDLSRPIVTFRPWGRRASTRIVGYKQCPENKTRRIPESVSGPLLRWALFMVDYGVDDVLKFLREVPVNPKCKRLGPKSNDARVEILLQELERDQLPIPVNSAGKIDWWALSNMSGLSRAVLEARRDIVSESMVRLGSGTAIYTKYWSTLPGTSVPWRRNVARHERRRLILQGIGACYVVVALLSGMRDSEVTSLAGDCLRAVRDEDGSIRRYEVDGRIYKGSRQAQGKQHTWVVIEPVARAIAAMQRIAEHVRSTAEPAPLAATPQPYLFTNSGTAGPQGPLTSGSSLYAIRTFIAASNQLATDAAHEAEASEARTIRTLYGFPPDETGADWRFETKQFRRTLAWYIARQPFGVVAGMLQYGHASEIMFEGYAGTSDSGFREEILEFRQLGQMEDIVESFENWSQGTPPAGPMGPRLTAEFQRIAEDAGTLPGTIVDENRRNRMLKNVAGNLYPGFINDCFFYADHALCLGSERRNHAGPHFGDCKPDRCPNSLVAKRHLPALETCRAECEELLLRRGLTVPQRRAIEQQHDLYKGLISMVDSDDRPA